MWNSALRFLTQPLTTKEQSELIEFEMSEILLHTFEYYFYHG